MYIYNTHHGAVDHSSHESVCVKRMKIDVPVQSIRERLSLLDIKKQNRDLYDYINELPVTTDESTIDGVVLVTHPLDDENGKPDSFERIAIVCIGVEYTIYKKTQGVGEEEDNGSTLLRRGERRLRRTRHSYWNAQKTVAAAPYTYYNNKHDILNEFTYKCNARFACSKCSKKTDTKCIPCGNAYICVRCHTHTELAGDDIKIFKQSLVKRLDELTAVKKTAHLQKREGHAFCSSNVQKEYVVVVRPEELPWDEPPTEVIEMDEGVSIKVY